MDIDLDSINYEKLRAARGKRSAVQVARIIGITYQHLWNIETGKRRPSVPVLMKLCALYDLSLDKIVPKVRRVA